MRLEVDHVKSAARGSWLSIFDALGISVPLPPGEHGPCPICRDGTDRFRLDKDTSDGTFFCNQCSPHAGDGLGLVMRALCLSFSDTLAKVSEIVGSGSAYEDAKVDAKKDNARKRLNDVWQSSKKLSGGDPVAKYLHARGLVLTPKFVRFCPECYESETKTKLPAMVAMFVGTDGKPISIHRTYLDGDKKANLKSPKKIMPAAGAMVGGAVRLFDQVDGAIGIAEGIETAIAAHQIAGIPTWAALTSTLLEGFIPPDDIRKIVIFGDCDANFTGQKAAYTLANRIHADRIIEVEFPPDGKDWNDYLLKTKG